MNPAALLSVCVAMLQAGMGLLMLAVSRAPGWHAARVFAAIALSAAVYSTGNIPFVYGDVSDATRIVAGRISYLAASVHVAAWMIHTFGNGTFSLRVLPRWTRAAIGLTLLLGTVSALTAWHVVPGRFDVVTIAWAGVTYRFPTLSLFGEVVAVHYLPLLGIVAAEFVRRARRGAPGAVGHLVGFAFFFACVITEVLVTMGVLSFFFLADLGFLAVVVPLAMQTVQRFIADAQRLAAQSAVLSHQVEVRTLERDQAHHALLDAERHAALGRLAAGVGHEINNPLTYLRLNVELIREWVKGHNAPPDVCESVESVLDGADRIRRVVDTLRAYSRPSTGELAAVALEDVAQAALDMLAHRLRNTATVDTAFSAVPRVAGEESKLVQITVSILLNAMQAVADGPAPRGERRIVVATHTTGDGLSALEVRDNGPGISREHLRRVAEPFFTTRGAVGATGLGLFLARSVTEHLGGRLAVESTAGDGTTVRIELPPMDAAHAIDAPGGAPGDAGPVAATR